MYNYLYSNDYSINIYEYIFKAIIKNIFDNYRIMRILINNINNNIFYRTVYVRNTTYLSYRNQCLKEILERQLNLIDVDKIDL